MIPTQEARITYAVQPKDQNNIVTNSIKTLKMVHIKKNLKKKKPIEFIDQNKNDQERSPLVGKKN